MRLIQQILQLEGKHATVPQSTLRYIFFCCLRIRLFLEHAHRADCILAFRNNIAIFFTWISRFNTHQHKIILWLLRELCQLSEGSKIAFIYIWIYRRNNYGLFSRHMQYIVQIASCQSNSREGITTTRLNRNTYIVCQLVANRRNLTFRCGYRNLCLAVHTLDLLINSLQHRIMRTICILKNLNKLLRTDIVR